MSTDTLPRTVPLEPTTPIKPSEAIRLGCLIAPVQAFDRYFGNDDRTEACVMGAMSLGFGGSQGVDWEETPFDVYQIDTDTRGPLKDFVADCPAGCSYSGGWPSHLNDSHRWSRERIADWLEGLGL